MPNKITPPSPSSRNFFDFGRQLVGRDLGMARHRADRLPNSATRTNKQRQNQIGRGNVRFLHQAAHRRVVSQPAQPRRRKGGRRWFQQFRHTQFIVQSRLAWYCSRPSESSGSTNSAELICEFSLSSPGRGIGARVESRPRLYDEIGRPGLFTVKLDHSAIDPPRELRILGRDFTRSDNPRFDQLASLGCVGVDLFLHTVALLPG